jgi:serine/threonine protein kinase
VTKFASVNSQFMQECFCGQQQLFTSTVLCMANLKLIPEELFGPYEVYERLGVGGMATVHRAKELGIEGFERVVALKRLLPHLAEDASFVKAFVREAKLASMLAHVNIVQIFELGRVGGAYFISMEHIDGRDLRQVLRHARRVTGPPPIAVTLGILMQLCEALDYAHSKTDDSGEPLRIVHRDVSPSNLIMTSSGHLKVIDFGIAKAQSIQLKTQTGRVKGKLAYMAPEAISGKDLDARSDLFAAGVIAHELLTARPLFASKNEYQTIINVQSAELLPPSAFNHSCPPELDAVVLRALSRSPDERYVDAAEFRDALAKVAAHYQLAIGNRDIAAWITWAFSVEIATGAFSTVNSVTFAKTPSSGQIPSVGALGPLGTQNGAGQTGHQLPGMAGRGYTPSDAVPALRRASDSSPYAFQSGPSGKVVPALDQFSSGKVVVSVDNPSSGRVSGPVLLPLSGPHSRAHSNSEHAIPVATAASASQAARAAALRSKASTASSRQTAIDEEAAAEAAWGSVEMDDQGGTPIELDDVPDVSSKMNLHSGLHQLPKELSGGYESNTIAEPGMRATGAMRSVRITAPPVVDTPNFGAAIVERKRGNVGVTIVTAATVLAVAAGAYWYAGRERSEVPTKGPIAATLHPVAKFVTEPVSAEIRVAGQPAHVGSPFSVPLPPGTYQVEIIEAGYKSYLTALEMVPGENQTVRVVLERAGDEATSEATLSVNSTPPGAVIEIDGIDINRKTPAKFTVASGPHVVVLKQDGVEQWREQFVAEPNSIAEYSAVLSADRVRDRVSQKRIADSTSPRKIETPKSPPTTTPGIAPPSAVTVPTPGTTATTTIKPPIPPLDVTVKKNPVTPAEPAVANVTNLVPSIAPSLAPVAPPLIRPTAVNRLSGDIPTLTSRGEKPATAATKVCIDVSGKVTSASVLTKLETADQNAITNALRSWRYSQYKVNGVASPACFAVTLRLEQ